MYVTVAGLHKGTEIFIHLLFFTFFFLFISNMSNAKDLLRDRYLQLLLQITKTQPQAVFDMYGGTCVDGQLCGTDAESNRFRVNQLQSPMGTFDKAVIRASDLNRIEISYDRIYPVE